jgi:hypothetical protein
MNRKRLAFAVMVAVTICLASTSAMAAVEIHLWLGQKMMDDDLTFNILDETLSIGMGTDDQTGYGIGASFGGSNWPIMIAVDLITSSDDNTLSYGPDDYYYLYYDYSFKFDVDTTELNLGVRKFWGQKFRGYVGGGFSFITLDGQFTLDCDVVPQPARGTPFCDLFPVDIVDDDDSATGYWIQGGIGWLFGKRFSINFDLTYTDADVDLNFLEPTNLPARGTPPPTSESVSLEAGGTRAALMFGIKF